MRDLMHAWIKITTVSFPVVAMCLVALGLTACQDPPRQKVESRPTVISVKIPQEPPLPTVNDKPAISKEESVSTPVLPSEPTPEQGPSLSAPFHLALYSSTGKIDPFRPLIETQAKPAIPADEGQKKPTRELTPLEKFDLSQIRLVAVVLAESGKVAMVEEASGKGYVIKIGTYIGKDGGAVEQILQDRIVIREMVKDFRGKAVLRIKEMKLHKQLNEG
ncbi:PilP [Desulforapulum autotrophicum HRM2]|uniref:PilP n=1 Tax=Desulforapulum autotrophicum (strain ATCC 43914 / DSM 3382 / VKM B-1955 / HRM2) TaxID=177437 RepID=C0QLC8_DESAH|nr:pilus assembly protein PilP [Desulforapulum autotrophicum]ACN14214.1 PilP [Desulforapulum autotrophicum HRM2]